MASQQHIQRLQSKAKKSKVAKKKLKSINQSQPDLCKAEDNEEKKQIVVTEPEPTHVEIEVKQTEPDTAIPECAICKSKLKNPHSKQHISTKKHQKALQQWIGGPAPIQEENEEDDDEDEEDEDPIVFE